MFWRRCVWAASGWISDGALYSPISLCFGTGPEWYVSHQGARGCQHLRILWIYYVSFKKIVVCVLLHFELGIGLRSLMPLPSAVIRSLQISYTLPYTALPLTMRSLGSLLLPLPGSLPTRISTKLIVRVVQMQMQILIVPMPIQPCRKKDHTMRSSRLNSCMHSMCTAMHSSFYLYVPMGYNSFFYPLFSERGSSVSCLVICYTALDSLDIFILHTWDTEHCRSYTIQKYSSSLWRSLYSSLFWILSVIHSDLDGMQVGSWHICTLNLVSGWLLVVSG